MSNATNATNGLANYYETTANCNSVSPECPVDMTVYGYYPNLGANAFFCAYFAVLLLANLILGFRFKSWVYSRFVTIGCLAEMIGYIGRILMHANPWSNAGFETQICTLIFAPSFFAAAIYLTLKHIVRAIGPQFSPIKAALYPWIFISCDFTALLLQAIGGGIAASANGPKNSLLGAHIMLAGIVFQVATFTFLYVLAGIFVSKLMRGKETLTTEAGKILYGKDFKVFVGGIFVASLAVYVRCVYRIAELATGWSNAVMRNETEFIVLDGVMCAVAILALTLCHPGIFFKPMVPRTKTSVQEKSLHSDGSLSEV